MPLYIFSNTKRPSETVELVMSVHDEHVYEKDGIKWDRIWTKPQMSVDAKLDVNDPKSFVKYTETRAGKYGDLLDLSRECSEKRKDKNGGYDHVEEKMYENYSKARKGKKHSTVKKRELKEQMKKNPIFDIEI